MRQIPGNLFNMEDFIRIEPTDGAKWHLIQSCSGDQTDGYSGCPGIGIKRATTIFENKGYSWKTVVNMFKEKDLTEEDALINARLARILTADDYDFKRKKPIPWTPRTDYEIDGRTGSKTKAVV